MKLRLQITKESGIRFISHLEYLKTLEKAIRRARIPVAYSQGFNPHMKFSLASALSVGVTSRAEFLELYLREPVPLKDLVDALSCNLPMGIHIVRADLADDKAPKLMASVAGTTYLVKVPCAADPSDGLQRYERAEKALYTKTHGKGKGSPRIVDAKAFVPYVQASYEGGMLTLQFDCLVSQEGSMKAAELLKVLHDDFGLSLDLEKRILPVLTYTQQALMEKKGRSFRQMV